MIKKLLILPAAAAVLVTVFYLLLAIASLRQGYSWAEMDWEGKGYTTLANFLRAGDIGREDVVVEGKRCVDYYSFKDGVPFKTVCPPD